MKEAIKIVKDPNNDSEKDMISFPPDTFARPRKDFTCCNCQMEFTCDHAYHWYNVNGDCLNNK